MDIKAEPKTILSIFSGKTYDIDFYQREYKWDKVPVLRLLDDVHDKFNEKYEEVKKEKVVPDKAAVSNYPFYYMNSFVTNTDPSNGKVYVVDGQQRLTTITLILIAMYRTLESNAKADSNYVEEAPSKRLVENRIVGDDEEDNYRMNHKNCINVLRNLHHGKEIQPQDIVLGGTTAEKMVENYGVIEEYFKEKFADPHKFNTFIQYFLRRIEMIEIEVVQRETSMIFEAINDRGVRLKPYEILKGKLLSQIEKGELERGGYNKIWDEQVKKINEYGEDEINNFFNDYLLAKYFAYSGEYGAKFDSLYHRVIFSDLKKKGLRLDASEDVKTFLKGPFKYYTELYLELLKLRGPNNEENPFVYYNTQFTMRGGNGHSLFRLILSGVGLDDPEKEAKIRTISFELDRLFVLLNLQNAYRNNFFQNAVYSISSGIRNQSLENIREVFDSHIRKALTEEKNKNNTGQQEVQQLFQYKYFENITRWNIRGEDPFLKYFLARVNLFLAEGVHRSSPPIFDLAFMGHGRKGKNKYHIEHILAYNENNRKLFEIDPENPEQNENYFEEQRHRFGGLLLLKGGDNQSSGNESYKNKLRTYAGSLFWNETLREDTYKSKKDVEAFIREHDLDLRAVPDQYGPVELEYRHRLLFHIANITWDGGAEELPSTNEDDIKRYIQQRHGG